MEILRRELSDLREAHLVSQSDIGKLIEVKMLLEEDNRALVAETMKLESLYLIFRMLLRGESARATASKL